jgi:hypothetical protein
MRYSNSKEFLRITISACFDSPPRVDSVSQMLIQSRIIFLRNTICRATVKNNAALSRISAMALIVAASVRPSSPDYSRARTTISVTALNLLLRRVP